MNAVSDSYENSSYTEMNVVDAHYTRQTLHASVAWVELFESTARNVVFPFAR